jgi:plasmid stabilization system protein ParE
MPTLIVSPLAEEDLEEIWSCIAERDVEAADRLVAQSLTYTAYGQ